jgi:hypothetical protein
MATKLGTILADFTTSLATDIAIGGTTATLSSATDDDSIALPSGRYFFTLDGTNSSKEHISCDLVGTALTNIKSLSRQGVETTGCVRKHRIGTTVSLTDFGHIKFINDLIGGTTTLNASAPLGYDGAPASLTGNQLATVTYVLGVVNGGTVYFDQQTISAQTSGEALTINDIVYFKESDQRWYKVDADLTATFDTLQLGVVKTTAGTSGVTIQVAISGPVSGFTGLTAGSKYYVSNTAGAITTTPGTYSVFVGYALSTTILLFDPVPKTLPTQKEKDAMVGSQGIPASTNKFITQDNLSTGLTDQTQTTQNSSSTVGEASTTGLRNKLAQSFVSAYTKIRGVDLYKSADTGVFTGTVTVSLQADSAGNPSGVALATVTLTNMQWRGFAVGEFEAIFASEYASITVGSTYHIVIETSTADTSNHPNIGINTAGGYSGGSVKYNNATDGWVAVANIDLYFKTLVGDASQLVKTNTSGKIENTFYDLTEMPIPAYQQTIPVPGSVHGIARATCNQTGSVMFIYTDAANELTRYSRDSITSAYTATHNVSSTVGSETLSASLVVLGDYLYIFYDAGASMGCYRYLAADLTGEQLMTVPSITEGSSPNSNLVYTDGKHIYFRTNAASTTVYTFSVSGTTITTVTTDSITDFGYTGSMMFDGKNPFYGEYGGTTYTIKKLTDSIGSTTETTTKIVYRFTDAPGQPINYGFLINIDTQRMYLGFIHIIYDETGAVADTLELIPVTKP